MKAGEGARELRELPEPLALNGGALERSDRDDDATGAFPDLPSFLSRVMGPDGPDHSLSVAGELTESSKSPVLLLSPPPLVEADPETRLSDDELELKSFSFSFSFSLNPMNIRDRASLYAASRSSMVIRFLPLPPVALLRPPRLPDSDGSMSEKSASSPATEPA